jgi:prepilin-type N-terminal cleavage/methylation domain-containing protein
MALRKTKGLSGFTLIEVLIASALATMVIAIIYSIYAAGSDIWEIKRYQTDLKAQGRQVISNMASELRKTTRTSLQSPSPNLIIPAYPNNNNITFYLPQVANNTVVTDAVNGTIVWDINNTIQYVFDLGQKVVRRVETIDPAGNRTMANDVTNIQFIDNSINSSLYLDELKVQVTLAKTTPRQRNISTTLSSVIKLRN